jgi:hypothetical protein
MSKYKYLGAIKFTIISKLLGYRGKQGVRLTSVGHNKLFTMLNDAVGEVIEKLGCEDYKKNHKIDRNK